MNEKLDFIGWAVEWHLWRKQRSGPVGPFARLANITCQPLARLDNFISLRHEMRKMELVWIGAELERPKRVEELQLWRWPRSFGRKEGRKKEIKSLLLMRTRCQDNGLSPASRQDQPAGCTETQTRISLANRCQSALSRVELS